MVDSKGHFEPAAASRGRLTIALLIASTLCAIAISGQSLWIDESYTALKAQQTTLLNWWQEMRHAGGSDLQMPLYMFWIWLCGQFFGSSEIALRAVNLFWILPGLLALSFALARQPRMQLAVFLVAVCNPFVWYYLNEARPYAMQIGAGLFLSAALCHWSERTMDSAPGESLWVWVFAAALVALSGASMLGMIWAVAAMVAAIYLAPREQILKSIRNHIFAWLTIMVLLTALGFYYLWTLKAGARASDIATTDWKNAAFIGYELFGFAGLGPGRLEIRDGGLQVFRPYAPELGLFAMLVLVLNFYAFREAWGNYPRKKILGLVGILAVPAVFILVTGFVMHFRVLGRHFAPLLPAVIFWLGLGASAARQRNGIGKLLVVGYFAMCLSSELALRFVTRHAKDDYRSAATLARTALADRQTIWWSADPNTAAYYHLSLATNFNQAGRAFALVNPSAGDLAAAVAPRIIFISRPDIYDPHGVLADYLSRNDFEKTVVMPAFRVWEKTGHPVK